MVQVDVLCAQYIVGTDEKKNFQERKSAHHFRTRHSTTSSHFNGNACNDAFVREKRNSELI